MIECKDVKVKYGKKEVLHSVSFTAEPSRITVILGKNGCGKSTLLRAVSGLIPYDGSISVDGNEIRSIDTARRARCIALMPQMLRSPGITVRQLVSYGRNPYTGRMGILSPADREKVEEVMEKTGISALAESYLGCISGGERQKAYFAMLLAQDTPNLLLDEPGAHLDTEYMKNLCDFLRAERDAGKTVVAVLHDINRAIELADLITVLHNGARVFCGTPKEFCAGDIPETVFGLQRLECRAAKANTLADNSAEEKKILFM